MVYLDQKRSAGNVVRHIPGQGEIVSPLSVRAREIVRGSGQRLPADGVVIPDINFHIVRGIALVVSNQADIVDVAGHGQKRKPNVKARGSGDFTNHPRGSVIRADVVQLA